MKNNKRNLLAWFAMIGLLVAAPTWAQEEMTAAGPEATAAAITAEPSETMQAEVLDVKGEHTQYSTDGGETWEQLTVGLMLDLDAQVRTGFASGCSLQFGEHSTVEVQALSSVRIADYTLTHDAVEHSRTMVQYGAVRCGVERGRVKADTQISTPVSTLAIRGTWVYVAYAPGVPGCNMWVEHDGPAWAYSHPWGAGGLWKKLPNKRYRLYEGMRTDYMLTRHGDTVARERTVWVEGNADLGAISKTEEKMVARIAGALVQPTAGRQQYTDSRNLRDQRVEETVLEEFGPCYECWQSN